MDIASAGVLKHTSGEAGLQEILRERTSPESMNQELANTLAGINAGANAGPAVVNSISAEARSRSGGLMSGNFVGSYEESEYLAATKQSLIETRHTEIVRDFDLMAFLPEDMKAEMAKHKNEQAQRVTQAQEAMQAAEASLNQFKATMDEQTAEAMQTATEDTASKTAGNEGSERVQSVATGEAGSAAATPQVAAAAATAYAPTAAQVSAQATASAAPAPIAPSTQGGAFSGQGVAKIALDVNV